MVGGTYVITEELGNLLKEGTVICIYAEDENYYHIHVVRSPVNGFFSNFKVAKELKKYFRLIG